jgi:hypothetical protein
MKVRLFAARYKVTIAFLLMATFLLILGKNIVDRNNSKDLASSFTSIYEDRLLVEGYIFEMSNLLHHKKAMLHDMIKHREDERAATFAPENIAMNKLVDDYEKTNLTAEEATVFHQFKSTLAAIEQEELGLNNSQRWVAHYATAMNQLRALSAIQMQEAHKLNKQSQQIFSGASFFTEIEFVGLILSCIVVQLLLATGNDRPRFPMSTGLN